MYDADLRGALSRDLAVTFSGAEWTVDALAEAGAGSLDRWPAWMTALAMTVLAVHRSPPRDPGALVNLIADFLRRRRSWGEDEEPPVILRHITATPAPPHVPPAERFGWRIADIASLGELAERLELSHGQLAWLADVRGLERTVGSERLRNYRYRTIPRQSGLPRVVEAPKARLKEIQRWLLHEILDQVPAHPAAHGFVRDRSAVTHAELHTGQRSVLRLDLKDFFASVSAGRIYGIWTSLGYSPQVSHVLTGLSTNVVPRAAWQAIAERTPPHEVQPRFRLGRLLATPHLPQGSPSSPALANLAAFGLDRRLSGLAAASGLTYSRYADDLTFSGSEGLHRRRDGLEATVTRIVDSEGFSINPVKSAIQSDGGRQTVCGVVVNRHTNVRRADYDRLKATLHNCVTDGSVGQNHADLADFRAHLLGRISWMAAVNPARGRKLRLIFDDITWPGDETRHDHTEDAAG